MRDVIDTTAAIYTIHSNGVIETESKMKYPIVGTGMEFTGTFCEKLKPKREIKQVVNNRGYLSVRLAGKTKMVHRLVAESFIDNPENKPYVNHINGVKLDNSMENLEWCTHLENMQHARKERLFSEVGLANSKRTLLDSNPNSRLSDEAIKDIRDHFKKRCTQYGAGAFAKKYGVSPTTISYVVNFRKHYANY